MPHDPVRVSETQAWLAKARSDMEAGGILLAASSPRSDAAVFHAQQATEKVLKAFLAWHDQPFRKTHNLLELGEQCCAVDSTLEPLLRQSANLTEYAWKYRYPGDIDEPSVAEAQEALTLAGAVFDAVAGRLSFAMSQD